MTTFPSTTSCNRYRAEKSFLQSKDDDPAGVLPLRHWTDGNIRCHILACIITLAFLRLIEIRLRRTGLELSAAVTMEHMKRLHSCLCRGSGKNKPSRTVEEPTESRATIMRAFGHEVSEEVLQKITA